MTGRQPCPLPADPTLAEVATALQEAGAWGSIVDRGWRLVHMTDDIRLSNGRLHELVPLPLGLPYFSHAALEVMLGWSGGQFALDAYREMLRRVAGWMTADLPGGEDEVRGQADPRLHDVLADAAPAPAAATTIVLPARYTARGAPLDVVLTALRVRAPDGTVAGTAFVAKPAAGMAVLGTLTAAGDLRHFLRMQSVAKAARHPAAILFGDLEASSPLSRRLPAGTYFALGRRLVREADRTVVDAGGLVGRHTGDGVVAVFLAEHAGSESAAARACVAAMRALRAATDDVAARSGLAADEVVMRFGLHWGAMVHVGQIATVARTEVNALGDEMNEAARIEACASGGRALASKALVERLDPEDALALGLHPDRLSYTALGDLRTATDKARRDAPAIAVTEV